MLSQYVYLLNLIADFSIEDSKATAQRRLMELIMQLREKSNVAEIKNIRNLENALDVIGQGYDNFADNLKNCKNFLEGRVRELGEQYKKESTRWFHKDSPNETSEYRLNRTLNIDEQSHDNLTGYLLRAADWRYPGLVLGPGREQWIKHMVALDPLYIADVKYELLKPAIHAFAPTFQRRMRDYVITEIDNANILGELPRGQFAWVFAYNYFNYRPLEVIDQYLREIWFLMRPGGRLLFTFNDCDYAHGVGLVEQGHFMCYTPGQEIVRLAESHGWQVEERYRGLHDTSWLVLAHPGHLSSLRGAQCLAKIVAKSK